jgi:hypothetical protein
MTGVSSVMCTRRRWKTGRSCMLRAPTALSSIVHAMYMNKRRMFCSGTTYLSHSLSNGGAGSPSGKLMPNKRSTPRATSWV